MISSGDHFVQWSGTMLAILVEGHPRNIPVELFCNLPMGYKDMSFKGFSSFSSGSHFVQQSKTIFPILVQDHPRNISVISGHWSTRICCL